MDPGQYDFGVRFRLGLDFLSLVCVERYYPEFFNLEGGWDMIFHGGRS
jgi:hypothetical protein